MISIDGAFSWRGRFAPNLYGRGLPRIHTGFTKTCGDDPTTLRCPWTRAVSCQLLVEQSPRGGRLVRSAAAGGYYHLTRVYSRVGSSCKWNAFVVTCPTSRKETHPYTIPCMIADYRRIEDKFLGSKWPPRSHANSGIEPSILPGSEHASCCDVVFAACIVICKIQG